MSLSGWRQIWREWRERRPKHSRRPAAIINEDVREFRRDARALELGGQRVDPDFSWTDHERRSHTQELD